MSTVSSPRSGVDESECHIAKAQATNDQKIAVSVLGRDIPVDPEEDALLIDLGRIARIENLEDCRKLRTLRLNCQHISKLENLENNVLLETLELYDNHIKQIENISHLTKLKCLDLAFNKIRKLENLETLTELEVLYVSSNKITKVEGLTTLVNLRILELGSNRIRVLENLETLFQLEELWVGRNKLTSMVVPSLPRLKRISLQSNRLTEWDPSLFENCPNIEELYLSHNRLSSPPPDIAKLQHLRVLDLAGNCVTSLESIGGCSNLVELWLNDTAVRHVSELDHLKMLTKLQTIYLERSPLHKDLGPGYRQAILDRVPWLQQLDALMVTHIRPSLPLEEPS